MSNSEKIYGMLGLSSETRKYPIGGFLFGLMFPIIAWTVDFVSRDLDFTLSGIWEMHTGNPLQFVIDMAPFILGGVAYLLARKIQKDNDKLALIISDRDIYVEDISRFSRKIGKGNYDTQIGEKYANDYLARSLAKMRDNLKGNIKKEEKQNWIITGKDKISGTLRNYPDISELAYNVLIDIIDYTNAIQGSFYIYNEEKQKLINYASYAYDRRKYINQEFAIGQGLIGQAGYEMSTIYRKEIPENYVTISSGILGEKKPGSILIVPLISDEKLRGVIELATIENEFSALTIEFIEDLSDIIGQTIFNLLINTKTKNLLEESQQMTEELQENEEELRQNAEEMRSTQEELEKTNDDLGVKIQEVEDAQKRMYALLENASEVISIYDEKGIVLYESPSIKTILGYDPKDLIGKRGFKRISGEENKLEQLFNQLLTEPENSKTIEFEYTKADGKTTWLETKGQNLIKNPAIGGIIFNTRDITIRKIAEEAQRRTGQMQSLSENSPDLIIRVSLDNKIYYTNPIFEKYTGINIKEVQNKSIHELEINPTLSEFITETVSSTKKSGKKQELEVVFETPFGERIMKINSIPELDDNKAIESVLLVAHDITIQKQIENKIKETSKKIKESINYAERIQTSILPDTNYIHQYLPKSFIFYRPRDVVSGDFPWFFKRDDFIYIAAVDCTGHGVPGALLSFVGYFLLNNVVDHSTEKSASKILDEFHHNVRRTLRQEEDGAKARDGMDIAFCKINTKTNVLEYSGAHRPLYLLRDGELQEFKGDRKAIGGIPHKKKLEKDFTNHSFEIKESDKIFFFSDGLPDQINEQMKKYKASRIRDNITNNQKASMKDFESLFEKDFEEWKNGAQQVDDVLLIGIEF